jgi:N-acetylglutamate synthase-like GNAT family acetyltransferase
MYTSYEDRLAMLHEFQDGSQPFQSKMKNPVWEKHDGWELALGDSQQPMLNSVIIYSSRKEIVDEVIAALEKYDRPANIKLVGPGITLGQALAVHGYSNLGGTPFMAWAADNSLDSFELREGLSVRRLHQEDLSTLVAIFMDVFKMDEAMIEAFTPMLLTCEQDHAYGLIKDGEVVSVVSAVEYNDSIGIWNMGTPTEHQKNGYGQELLTYVMKIHKEKGSKRFYLHATTAGKFLYDKIGWTTLDYFPYLAKVDK